MYDAMKVLWNLLKMGKSLLFFILSKMCLWDFFFSFIYRYNTSYYQAHILAPSLLIPPSHTGEWCWVGTPSTCPVLSHGAFSTAIPSTCLNFSNSALPKYSTQCFCHLAQLDPKYSVFTYRIHVGSSCWYLAGLKGECGGLGRCFEVLEDYSFLRRDPMLHRRAMW